MLNYIIRRILMMIPTVIGVFTVVFLLIHFIPGDPVLVMLGDDAPMAAIESMRARLGLDQPLHVQYFRFFSGMARLDFGRSFSNNRPVLDNILQMFPHTLRLAVSATLVSVLVGIPFGIVAALNRNRFLDRAAMVVSLAGVSAPNFWLGLLLLSFFSVNLGWFPVTGAGAATGIFGNIRYLVLPAVALGVASAALLTRLTRSSMLEVIQQDYIRTARAKGLNERRITYKHALKNALIPVVTVVGINVGKLLGSTVTAEIVFTRPGIGALTVRSIYARDFPQVQTNLMLYALVFMLINLLVDISYGFLDPRIKYN